MPLPRSPTSHPTPTRPTSGRRLSPTRRGCTRARSRSTRCCTTTSIPGSMWLYSNGSRSEEHTSELQSRENLVCRLLLEKKKKKKRENPESSTSIRNEQNMHHKEHAQPA